MPKSYAMKCSASTVALHRWDKSNCCFCEQQVDVVSRSNWAFQTPSARFQRTDRTWEPIQVAKTYRNTCFKMSTKKCKQKHQTWRLRRICMAPSPSQESSGNGRRSFSTWMGSKGGQEQASTVSHGGLQQVMLGLACPR